MHAAPLTKLAIIRQSRVSERYQRAVAPGLLSLGVNPSDIFEP
jgi:hypothetical protein